MIALGFSALGNRFQLVVVDQLGVPAHLVEGGPIELAAEAEPVAVREMAAVREVEAEDGVARLQHGHIGGGVGLRAGVRLHVDVLAAEDLLGAVARQVLDHIGVFASAVVAAARVALGVLVGKDRAGRFKHGFGDKVFAGDHLQPLVLAEGFLVNGSGNFRVGLGEGGRHAISHARILIPFCLPETGRQFRVERGGAGHAGRLRIM